MDLTASESSLLLECETVVDAGLQSFVEVGSALMRIRDGKLYRDHGRFEEYCQERFLLDRTYAHRLIDAAVVTANVHNCGQTLPKPPNEATTRELAKLEPKQQIEAWSAAVDTAKKDGKMITAKLVRETVARVIRRLNRPGRTGAQP
jgi:hypothetical protein